jgi:uncharacterized protein with FMN-binding domain
MKRPALRPALRALIALAAAMAVMSLASCATKPIEIGSPDLTKVADGAWRGDYDGGLVQVEVEVTVKAHAIESVTILKHRNGRGKSAERITADIVAKQSLGVDTVSGATYSSKCILKAVELALEKGGA